MPSLLIVDDLISIHEMLEAVIQPTGYKTAFATDGEKGLARYKAEKYDLVLADIDMKPMDGITLLKQLKAYDPTVVVIIMTAYASTESAIQALKFGAFDYLQKPFKVDELMQALKRGLEFRRSVLERETLGTAPAVQAGDFEARLPGPSAKIKRLIAQLKKLATARTPVLISGEIGSGHLVAAELLHAAGSPAGSPFITIDCRQSSLETLRAGLLGQNGAGGAWVQEAQGGTLFLQHLQSLHKDAQVEMISVLRNNAHTFRLVCSSEEDLEKLAEEGGFNEELFYRVAALPVHLPPLRERPEDIPVLLKEAAAKVTNPQFDAKMVEFAEDALAAFRAYFWPGNLFEFTQVVSRLVASTETRVITAAQLPVSLRELKDWPPLADYLAAQEKDYLARALQACRGDKARAARALGIDVSRFG
ncbi:sigma-54 dependent transcriptional regulator [Opitutus sp. GAS368]|jgi:two-component system response regulator HydG|uniref:sigma-54-dependent transcriptional regulator n=1 Tax=Opitutus sp. GAS368 TaxID=1882749 RepID=UPI0008795B0A|nr:sigma-54 dependent transcriptional regulator [Opitutus sp. GAS368]SDR87453.1 two-component system, NtrC family, response regulator HydG [Opitutus sp. GAS368]